MKTAISIPDDVFQAAEVLCKRLGMSRSQLYARAVAAFVASHRNTDVRERLDALYAEEESRLDPLLVQWQSRVLPQEEW